MAKMNPEYREQQLNNIESAAEANTYRAFRDQLSDDWHVYHSITWIMRREADEARDGEIDFVVCHPDHGYITIEVKGGGVGFDAHSGEWYSISRSGRKHDISDPVGQAWDLMGTTSPKDRGDRFTPYQSRIKSLKSWNIKFSDRMETELSYANWDELDRWYRFQAATPEIFLRMALDGTLRYRDIEEGMQIPAPATPPQGEIQTFPQFVPVKLDDNAGEIGAKGYWENGFWTVEFRRARVTPAMNYSDVVFNRLVQFSVHIFDQVERVDESSESGRLWLQFLPNSNPLPGEEDQLLVKE